MSLAYLHGVETIETTIGGLPVNIVKSSVVALLGIAPIGPVNTLTLCLSPDDDAQFGDCLPGFNIPKTLQIIRALAGNCPVLVVNTFNLGINETAIALESHNVVNGAFSLEGAPLGPVTVYEADGVTLAPIVSGVDYEFDTFGNFTALSTNVANGTTYKCSYSALNTASVTNAQLIGGTTNPGGVRTGLALFQMAFNEFGFNGKIFIAPTYAHIPAISTALASSAAAFRGIYLVDAPAGTTVVGAIAGRGLAGTFGFNIADQRAYLLFPELQTMDDYAGVDTNYPYSAFMAGLIVWNDNTNGYWFSPSNKTITNATGVERPIQWSVNADSEANQLNAAGICTVAQGFGTGILSWGNRSSAFPTNTSPKNFISVRRTDDVVIETMELAALPMIDQPISQAWIDTVRESGNTFIRTLIGRGALLPGSKVVYLAADNPSTQLAAGQVVFERIYMIPTPAERVTYKDVMDISLLTQFK